MSNMTPTERLVFNTLLTYGFTKGLASEQIKDPAVIASVLDDLGWDD
jgi:hypothetical protein